MAKTNNDMSIEQSIEQELISLFETHANDYPDSVNEYILERRGKEELFSNIKTVVSTLKAMLVTIVEKYHLASVSDRGFIDIDIKRLALLMFMPYFSPNNWLTNIIHDLEIQSSNYKFEHGINDELPPDDLYNSFIEYLKDFVVNLSA